MNEKRLRDGLRPLPWTVDALCTQYPHEIWFPDTPGQNAREAKAICAQCPVQQQCLDLANAYETGDFGTDTSYPTGIWGGPLPQTARPAAACT